MANQTIRTLNFNTPICGYHSKTTSKDYLGRQVKQGSNQHTHNNKNYWDNRRIPYRGNK